MRFREAHAWASFAVLASLLVGCGGGAPLFHSVQAVPKNTVTFGAGFSGAVLPLVSTGEGAATDRSRLEEGAVSPGLAPWVGARLGVGEGVDVGLAYTGRLARFDARRVFSPSTSIDVSMGLGASGIFPRRIERLGLAVGGVGGDVPLLVGWRSAGDVYSVWLGARGGAEMLRGRADPTTNGGTAALVATSDEVSGWHAHAGGLLGLRVGFRHLHALLEIDAAMHWAEADLGTRRVSLGVFAIAPGGALVARF